MRSCLVPPIKPWLSDSAWSETLSHQILASKEHQLPVWCTWSIPWCIALFTNHGFLVVLDHCYHHLSSFRQLVNLIANDSEFSHLLFLIQRLTGWCPWSNPQLWQILWTVAGLTALIRGIIKANSDIEWPANNRLTLLVCNPMSCTSDNVVTIRWHLVRGPFAPMMVWSGRHRSVNTFLLLLTFVICLWHHERIWSEVPSL